MKLNLAPSRCLKIQNNKNQKMHCKPTKIKKLSYALQLWLGGRCKLRGDKKFMSILKLIKELLDDKNKVLSWMSQVH